MEHITDISQIAEVLSVTGLTMRVKNIIESNPALADVWVRGEISNFTKHSSGHLYFSLKDKDAQIKAVMFKRNAAVLRTPPGDGVEVVAYGNISVYEKRGEYQLYVKYMQPAGVGALYLEFEKLKNRLMEEGLFDERRKRQIPAFPRRVAVVTSPTGAAVRDVIKVITRRYPAVEVTVVPALVQGAEAAASVRAALARAASLSGVDTILLVRGGGSIEDLWAFNDEALARDIAACAVPVITGVGHETDFTIADFVSDLRAPTPSAAAELAVPDIAELRLRIENSSTRLRRYILEFFRYHNQRIDTAGKFLSPARLMEQIDRRSRRLDDLVSSAGKSLGYRIRSMRDKLVSAEQRFSAMDPRRVLERGYSICADAATGKPLRSAKSARHGQLLNVTMGDGDFNAKVDRGADERQKSLEF